MIRHGCTMGRGVHVLDIICKSVPPSTSIVGGGAGLYMYALLKILMSILPYAASCQKLAIHQYIEFAQKLIHSTCFALIIAQILLGNPTWDWYVEYKGMSWLVLLNTWIKQTALPVLVVRYETLVTNTTQQLARMLDFLDVPVDKERLKCLEENSEGYFKRHDHLNFDPYTRENKKAINRIIEQGAHEFGIHYKKR